MPHEVIFTKPAGRDLRKLDRQVVNAVIDAIETRALEPHTATDALGGNLKGAFKIKLLHLGIRIVYIVEDNVMRVVVLTIGKRENDAVYQTADIRLANYKLENPEP